MKNGTFQLACGAILFLSTTILLDSCRDANIVAIDSQIVATLIVAPTLPTSPYNYANLVLPNYLTTPPVVGIINTPNNNQITDNGATLGRVLFYDKNLSFNNLVSCASCHKQAFSFSDTATFSSGFLGGNTTRNSMSLLNARYYPNGHFFWDERSASAEAQASRPIVNAVEMGMTMPSLVTRLRSVSYYPTLFQKAYGTTTIDSA